MLRRKHRSRPVGEVVPSLHPVPRHSSRLVVDPESSILDQLLLSLGPPIIRPDPAAVMPYNAMNLAENVVEAIAEMDESFTAQPLSLGAVFSSIRDDVCGDFEPTNQWWDRILLTRAIDPSITEQREIGPEVIFVESISRKVSPLLSEPSR